MVNNLLKKSNAVISFIPRKYCPSPFSTSRSPKTTSEEQAFPTSTHRMLFSLRCRCPKELLPAHGNGLFVSSVLARNGERGIFSFKSWINDDTQNYVMGTRSGEGKELFQGFGGGIRESPPQGSMVNVGTKRQWRFLSKLGRTSDARLWEEGWYR